MSDCHRAGPIGVPTDDEPKRRSNSPIETQKDPPPAQQERISGVLSENGLYRTLGRPQRPELAFADLLGVSPQVPTPLFPEHELSHRRTCDVRSPQIRHDRGSVPTICEGLAPSSAARTAAIWSRSSSCWGTRRPEATPTSFRSGESIPGTSQKQVQSRLRMLSRPPSKRSPHWMKVSFVYASTD